MQFVPCDDALRVVCLMSDRGLVSCLSFGYLLSMTNAQGKPSRNYLLL